MNITIETFGIITTVLAIAGVVLNNRMDRKCFWFWIVSNAISCGLHCYIGLWSLAVRDAAFLVLAFDGLRRWRGKLSIDDCRLPTVAYRELINEPVPLRKVEPVTASKLELEKIKADFEKRHTGPYIHPDRVGSPPPSMSVGELEVALPPIVGRSAIRSSNGPRDGGLR